MRSRPIYPDLVLLANAASFGSIFDTEDRHLVIDEAHRLEEIMAEAFGARVSYARIIYVLRQARKRCEGAHAATNTAEMAADLFFEDLRGDSSAATRLHQSPPRAYGKLVESLRELRNVLANAPNEEANLLQGMVGRLRRDLESFYSKPDDDYAYSVLPGRNRSGRGKNYPELKSWLVETADVFRDEVLPLFEDSGVVLTSATLASSAGDRRSFAYARTRLGLGLGLDEKIEDDQSGDTDMEDEGGLPRQAKALRVSEFAGAEVFDYGSRVLIYAEDGKSEHGENGKPSVPSRKV
jgi:hypothetical protein